MSIETELKLSIAPAQLARLKRHVLLRQYSVTRPVTRRLHNIYYDTPKFALHKKAMALRLRRDGKQWLQTLKGGGSVEAGLHRRNEWEVPVQSAELDFSIAEAAELKAQLPDALRRKLQPVFVTDFSRSSRMLDYQGASIELSIDQGEVSTQEHSTPICEIELELKSGDPGKLFELALDILDIVPFELETVSKAEQGYQLLSGHTEQPLKSAPVKLGAKETLAKSLQILIWSCLEHLQGNLHGVMQSDDDEYLHQMRVAMRRLRVVLRMAEKFRADPQLSALSGDVAALCVALGRIREWDVFISRTMWPMSQRMAGHQGLQALLATCEKHRTDCYASLRSDAQARGLQRLLLRFSIWMNGTYWQNVPHDIKARQFVSRRLRKLAARFRRSGTELKTLDSARLHELRILAKKLRYSAEFFSSLYGKGNTRKFESALGEVQEVLGQINDIAVADRLLAELKKNEFSTAHHEAITLAKGWIAHDLSDQFASLHTAVRRFNKQGAFWQK